MSFPTSVAYAPAPAVEGDFCDANPRSTVNAGPGGLIAGTGGVVVGRFAWASSPNDTNGAPAAVTNAGSGAPTGFLHREMQALNTTFLSESTNTVPAGFPVTLFKTGGFWVVNRGSTAATMNQKVFASNTDGTCAFGAAGATIAGFTETKWFAMSPGAVGNLIKISATPNG